jgi:hypothetical protein
MSAGPDGRGPVPLAESIPQGGISDDELTLLALSLPEEFATPTAVEDPFARRMGVLPLFYMPAAAPGPRQRWMAYVALALIGVFLFATVLGYCLTDGVPLL